jgi:hypothetical protein
VNKQAISIISIYSQSTGKTIDANRKHSLSFSRSVSLEALGPLLLWCADILKTRCNCLYIGCNVHKVKWLCWLLRGDASGTSNRSFGAHTIYIYIYSLIFDAALCAPKRLRHRARQTLSTYLTHGVRHISRHRHSVTNTVFCGIVLRN